MAFGFGFGMPRSFAVPPFSPASLFANGEQGWWYDPSNYGPNGTLYQDSAGTTPVTAVEQPVGLQLDLSKGLVLGSEAVVNGNFSAGSTGYVEVLNGTVSYATGAMVAIGITGNTGVYQDVPVVSGTPYKVSWVIGTSTNWRINIYNGAGFGTSLYNNGTGSSTSGVFTAIVFPTTTTIRIYAHTGTGTVATFDDISVKSLPGNHRFQTTSANRPVVSARVNLLTKTEQFDNAAWAKSNATVSANAATAPDGTLTAGKLVESVGVTRGRVTQSGGASTGYVISVYAKAAEWGFVALGITNGGGLWGLATFNLLLGTTAGGASYGGDSVDTATITTAGNGWYRCSVRVASGSSPVTIMPFNQSGDPVNPSPSLTGDGTSGIYIWGADLRPINQGVNLPAYQRVNTATDYDSTGFPVYIKPNGSNQFMQTNSINFTATDKMTVWQGVRKLSDATAGILSELSTGWVNNTGTFIMLAPDTVGTYTSGSRGTASVNIAQVSIASGYPAPISNVLSSTHDISGDLTTFRINGVAATPATGDKGAGNFGNYPAYFYARAGTSFFFNGHDYGSIARGAASTAAQITAGETYINNLTKAYAP